MSSNLPALLAHHLRCPANPDVRVSAIWCIINLTVSDMAVASKGVPLTWGQ